MWSACASGPRATAVPPPEPTWCSSAPSPERIDILLEKALRGLFSWAHGLDGPGRRGCLACWPGLVWGGRSAHATAPDAGARGGAHPHQGPALGAEKKPATLSGAGSNRSAAVLRDQLPYGDFTGFTGRACRPE